jgi:hypothetical protein
MVEIGANIMSKTLTVEFSGGFHAYQTATVRAKIEDRGAYLRAVVSVDQLRRLQRKFCGMRDCMCGGTYRADMSVPAGWESTSEPTAEGGAIFALREKA